ncbi:MAG: Rrf2 family transcriptional regulator [Phycisphaerae bacterium]|nr:Rrf2 family transcriptional regulator [Phycisphaerae bacterium]
MEMMRTKAASYALLAVFEIGKRARGSGASNGVQAGEVAQKYKLPTAYAAKIMSQLARAGVLRSDRGPHGGFRLNRPADKITLYDVFDGVGGLMPESGTAAVPGLPNAVQNTLNRTYNEVASKMRDILRKVTLSDVLGGNGR